MPRRLTGCLPGLSCVRVCVQLAVSCVQLSERDPLSTAKGTSSSSQDEGAQVGMLLLLLLLRVPPSLGAAHDAYMG